MLFEDFCWRPFFTCRHCRAEQRLIKGRITEQRLIKEVKKLFDCANSKGEVEFKGKIVKIKPGQIRIEKLRGFRHPFGQYKIVFRPEGDESLAVTACDVKRLQKCTIYD